MPEETPYPSATVPEQPEAKPPVRKTMPVVITLVVILGLIGLANISSLLSGDKKAAPASALSMRPAAPNAQQVTSFESQQQLQAKRDADEHQRQQELQAAMQQFQDTQSEPGPEAAGTPPMTSAQRVAIYGDSPNAPTRTSEISQVQAEAKQKQLAREKQQQDAVNSDTVAIDFAQPNSTTKTINTAQETGSTTSTSKAPPTPVSTEAKNEAIADSQAPPLEAAYEGKRYRLFEGTVLEGVVTNRVDGGLNGTIMVSLTTDIYSHDHQQLLLPQGTRLLGDVQSVASGQQRRLIVTFHRAIPPDGYPLWFNKFIALDQIGVTGLATKVNHGYLEAFAAAAAIGGLGGLAQIGNNGSILSPSTEIRNGISEQSATEGEQVLNHFLNRLPIITLKERERARVMIGTDLLLPAYKNHRMDPTL